MKTETYRDPLRLGLPLTVSFEPPATFRQTGDNALEGLKSRLLREALNTVVTTGVLAALRRAANEAAALAWLEPHPLLVFPTLFEEKAVAARKRALKQELVRARSAALMQEAA